MYSKSKIVIIIALLAFSFQLQAQKFGHLNSSQLLIEMPEVKKADEEIATYQNNLILAGEELVKAFEKSYNQYVVEANSGELSAVQMKQRESELQAENQNIQNYELQVQQLIATKKEELYSPILDRVKVALQELGKENGYTMIFDTSTGFLLHSIETEDVMPLIKTKLGL